MSAEATAASAAVTVVVTRTARPGCAEALETWLHGVGAAAEAFSGHLGLTVLRGATRPTGRDYTLIFRFATTAELEAWERSDVRADWLRRAEPLVAASNLQRLTGLETWFTLPGGAVVSPPPRWKMALVSWCVAFPLVQALNLTLGPLLVPLPAPLRGALVGAAMVLAMTYGLMPLATRLVSKWLYPKR